MRPGRYCIRLSPIFTSAASFGTKKPRVSQLVLEGTMRPDGNRDGNDGGHQRPEATVNSQLLSHVRPELGIRYT